MNIEAFRRDVQTFQTRSIKRFECMVMPDELAHNGSSQHERVRVVFFCFIIYYIIYILIQYSKLVELICQKKRNNQKRRYLRETFYIP